MEKIIFTNLLSQRIDNFLAQKFKNKSRVMWQNFIELGLVTVNDILVKPKYKISQNQSIIIDFEKIDQIQDIAKQIKPLNIALDIIFENKNLAIINKPSGIVTHSGHGNIENTLTGALINTYGKEALSDCGEPDRPGIVHRLDKDTTGLIIIAKNNIAHFDIANQIKLKTCKRKYLGLCYGVFVPSSGTIETGICRDNKDFRKRKAVSLGEGKIATTHYRTINTFAEGTISLVEFELETGRTHQIRVHALYKKHPLIGDAVYCNYKYNNLNKLSNIAKKNVLEFKRQALHSFYIKFTEPETHESLEFSTDLPSDMKNIIKIITDVFTN